MRPCAIERGQGLQLLSGEPCEGRRGDDLQRFLPASIWNSASSSAKPSGSSAEIERRQARRRRDLGQRRVPLRPIATDAALPARVALAKPPSQSAWRPRTRCRTLRSANRAASSRRSAGRSRFPLRSSVARAGKAPGASSSWRTAAFMPCVQQRERLDSRRSFGDEARSRADRAGNRSLIESQRGDLGRLVGGVGESARRFRRERPPPRRAAARRRHDDVGRIPSSSDGRRGVASSTGTAQIEARPAVRANPRQRLAERLAATAPRRRRRSSDSPARDRGGNRPALRPRRERAAWPLSPRRPSAPPSARVSRESGSPIKPVRQPSSRRRISLTALGFPLPPVSFMTAPTKKPISLGLVLNRPASSG